MSCNTSSGQSTKISLSLNHSSFCKLSFNIDQNISANVLSGKIKLQTGREGGGNSYIEFYDDSKNVYRKLVYNHIEGEWYIENKYGRCR